MDIYKNCKTFYARDVNSWRVWLSQNYNKEKSVFLILYKKGSNIPSISVDDAIDQALCFGWIDSKINKKDEISWYQYFAKRNHKSNWSRVNKMKVERLINYGLMAEPGLEIIRIAKTSGTWDALNNVEDLFIPEELQILFSENIKASDHWENFSRSVKRGILEWIFNAKKDETKIERIKKTVRMAENNKKANFDKE